VLARWQQCGSPASDYSGLVAQSVEGKKGKWRGGLGPFIGVGRGRITQGVKRNEDGEVTVARVLLRRG
jgi:hypothetical protein